MPKAQTVPKGAENQARSPHQGMSLLRAARFGLLMANESKGHADVLSDGTKEVCGVGLEPHAA